MGMDTKIKLTVVILVGVKIYNILFKLSEANPLNKVRFSTVTYYYETPTPVRGISRRL